MNRRSLITTCIATLSAPAIVRASWLMPIHERIDDCVLVGGHADGIVLMPPPADWLARVRWTYRTQNVEASGILYQDYALTGERDYRRRKVLRVRDELFIDGAKFPFDIRIGR